MKISVIIPTYMRDANLHGTLIMLFGQTRKADEIIVIDQTPDGAHDKSTEDFLKECAEKKMIKIVRKSKPCLTTARNVGIGNSSGDVLLFVDDDVIIGHDFVESHLACYSDQKVMVVTGQARPGSEKGLPVAPKHVEMTTIGFLSSSNSYIGSIENFNRVSGGNFSFRRSVYERIGGFDENLSGATHGEDIEFALRCMKNNIPIRYDSRPWIYHLASPRGGGRANENTSFDHWLYCRLYLANKHMVGKEKIWFVYAFLQRRYVLNKSTIINPYKILKNFFKFYRACLVKGKEK